MDNKEIGGNEIMRLVESVLNNLKEGNEYNDKEVSTGILELIETIPELTGDIKDNKMYINESTYVSCVANEDGIEVSLCLNNIVVASQKIDFKALVDAKNNM